MALTPKEQNFRYNMIKGRVAETLIQELFLSLGFNVFHYGMERSVPGITNLLKGIKSPVAREIRSMPDFIIQDTHNEVYFVEVKYRAKENFSFEDLPLLSGICYSAQLSENKNYKNGINY